MSIDLTSTPAFELLLLAVAAAVGGLAVGLLIVYVLRRLERRWHVTVLSGRLWQSPIVALAMISALSAVVAEIDRRWAPGLEHLLTIAQISSVAWLAVVLIKTLEKAALAKHPETGLRDEQSRHARTKIALVQRVATAAVVTLAVGAVLWTFPEVRAVGVTLLASAGVLSIIAGLAAQTTLSNLFAGVQIAFTDGIRVGDIVVVEGKQGRIEEITLTYVVVQIWNETRLILPCTFFITTPFENWSHSGNTAIGEVAVTADWRVPVSGVREHLQAALEESGLWDGRICELRVGDATPNGLVLLAQFSAASDAVEVLRFRVREALTGFLADEGADTLPRVRQERVEVGQKKETT